MSKERFTIEEKMYCFVVIDNEEPHLHRIIFDNKEEQWKVETLVEWLNRINDENEELTKQLSKAIVPKFKSEDVAYRIHHFTHKIEEVMISDTNIQVLCGSPRIFYTIAVSCCDKPITEIDPKSILQEIDGYITQEDEENLFVTRAEAEQKLKELEEK